MVPAWINFVSMLLLTGLLIRYLEATFPEKAWAKALMFIY